MLNRFLPPAADNAYRGYKIALWIFGFIVAVKALIGIRCIISPFDVASSADGVPLATFGSAAQQTVVSDFAIWGLALLTICFICALVLVRYRSLVPLMFAVLLLEQLARKLILYVHPVPITGSPPGFIVNAILLSLMAIGLVLSVLNRALLPRTAAAKR